MPKKTEIDHYSDKEALDFHIKGKSGKIEIGSSKPLTTKRDLSLAYSPGVAAPVKEISKNPELAYDYTSKGNLVAVISNGSAILGLASDPAFLAAFSACAFVAPSFNASLPALRTAAFINCFPVRERPLLQHVLHHL